MIGAARIRRLAAESGYREEVVDVRRAPLGEIGETDEVKRGPRPLLVLGLR